MKINYHMWKSAAGLTIIGNQLSNIASFISFLLWCMFHSFTLTVQDTYTSLRHMFNLLHRLLPIPHHHHRVVPISEPPPSPPRPVLFPGGHDVMGRDAELVMKRLGLDNNYQEPLADQEIAGAFDNLEPDLGDVREAFDVFDENKDGYVDARELNRVVGALGFDGFSEKEVERMIMAFDEDGDGRIDFGEFVKLMEGCC